MDSITYLKRTESCESYTELCDLFEEVKRAENIDRELFIQHRGDIDTWEIPDFGGHDQYKKLIPVFDTDNGGETILNRHKKFEEEEALPMLFKKERENELERLHKQNPRNDEGLSVSVNNLSDFNEQFTNLFSEGLLRDLNWDNVCAAGGSVNACLKPIPNGTDMKQYEKRKYYHDEAYPASDVDLFIYGLDEEAANEKLKEIYECICSSCPFQVACFRSAHAVTMVSQYPYRHVQVVLRLYTCIYEVLAGFDVDACCVLFDGVNVFTSMRGHFGLTRLYNTVDLSRRSPSYEMRLAKYASRGYAVNIGTTYNERRVDPNIFERPWNLLRGLPRLLVLERLSNPIDRLEYFNRQRVKKNLPTLAVRSYSTRIRGDLERLEKSGGAAEMSDYSTVFLPWGPGHNCLSIMRLVKKKDMILNGKYFAKDRPYNLHPVFFGTAEEILTDMAPDDPPIPGIDFDQGDQDDSEETRKLREMLKSYVRGRLEWIKDNPGAQRIGSFNPITTGDWEEGAYFYKDVGDLYVRINNNDADALSGLLENKTDVKFQRDFLGRSLIHVGLMAGAKESVMYILKHDLVDLALRMPDGRNALHLAAQYGMLECAERIIQALKSTERKEHSSDSDSNSRKISFKEVLNQQDHKLLTPLHYAIISGREEIVKLFIAQGSVQSMVEVDGTGLPVSMLGHSATAVFPVLLIPYSCPEAELNSIVEALFSISENINTGLMQGFNNVFHVCASTGNINMLRALLQVCSRSTIEKSVNAVNSDLNTPLMCALKNLHLDCAEELYNKCYSDFSIKLYPCLNKEVCGKAKLFADRYGPLQSNADWQVRRFIRSLMTLEPEDSVSAISSVCTDFIKTFLFGENINDDYVFSRKYGVIDIGYINHTMTSTKITELENQSENGSLLSSKDKLREMLARYAQVIEWIVDKSDDINQPEKIQYHTFMNISNLRLDWREGKNKITTTTVLKFLEKIHEDVQNLLNGDFERLGFQNHLVTYLSSKYEQNSYEHYVVSNHFDCSLPNNDSSGSDYSTYKLFKLGKSVFMISQLIALVQGEVKGERFVDAYFKNSPESRDATSSPPKTLASFRKKVEFFIFVKIFNPSKLLSQHQKNSDLPAKLKAAVHDAFSAVWNMDIDSINSAFLSLKQSGSPSTPFVDAVGNSFFAYVLLSPCTDSGHKRNVLELLLNKCVSEYHLKSETEPGAPDSGQSNVPKIDNLKLMSAVHDHSDNSDSDDGRQFESTQGGYELEKVKRNLEAEGFAESSIEAMRLQEVPVSTIAIETLLLQQCKYPYTRLDEISSKVLRENSHGVASIRDEELGSYVVSVDILELAVIQNDVGFLETLLSHTNKLKATPSSVSDKKPESVTQLLLSRTKAFRLAIALDRLEIFKTFVLYSGCLGFWNELVSHQLRQHRNLIDFLSEDDVSKVNGKKKKYKGMKKSVLLGGGKSTQRPNSNTPDSFLEMAASSGAIKIFTFLMRDGLTCTHPTSSNGIATLYKRMLESGNVPDLLRFVEKAKENNTFLHLFQSNPGEENDDLTLVQRGEPHEFLAAISSQPILEKGIESTHPFINKKGKSLVYFAIKADTVGILNSLLETRPEFVHESCDLDLEVQDNGIVKVLKERSPAITAVKENSPNCFRLLMTKDMNIAAETDIALIKGHNDIVYEILSMFTSDATVVDNGLYKMLTHQNEEGVNCLMQLCNSANVKMVDSLFGDKQQSRFLNRNHLFACNNQGKDVLHIAANKSQSNPEILEKLLTLFVGKPADMLREDFMGQTAVDLKVNSKPVVANKTIGKDQVDTKKSRLILKELFQNFDAPKQRQLVEFDSVREHVLDTFLKGKSHSRYGRSYWGSRLNIPGLSKKHDFNIQPLLEYYAEYNHIPEYSPDALY